jgi:hypothetical protein
VPLYENQNIRLDSHPCWNSEEDDQVDLNGRYELDPNVLQDFREEPSKVYPHPRRLPNNSTSEKIELMIKSVGKMHLKFEIEVSPRRSKGQIA